MLHGGQTGLANEEECAAAWKRDFLYKCVANLNHINPHCLPLPPSQDFQSSQGQLDRRKTCPRLIRCDDCMHQTTLNMVTTERLRCAEVAETLRVAADASAMASAEAESVGTALMEVLEVIST